MFLSYWAPESSVCEQPLGLVIRNGVILHEMLQINIFTLFFFQIYCAWSSTQVMDYVYLLFWNAFWTVAAVIAMGIFDRILPDHVLMQVPELYKRSRQHKYFSLSLFLLYLFVRKYVETPSVSSCMTKTSNKQALQLQ